MKKQPRLFVLLFTLLSACEAPLATESVVPVQPTQTPSPIITLAPSVRPTSTLNEYNQAGKDQYGEFRFCQVAPEWARFGSTTNVSVFGMPANDTVSIYIYSHKESATTALTDSNGYANADIIIPTNAPPDVNMVIVEATSTSVTCLVWLWSEEYLPTHYAGLTKTMTPTLSPGRIAITATQLALHNKLDKYCAYNEARGFRASPNGQWVEVFCSQDTIEIVRMDETRKWEVSSDTLINPYTEYFGGVNHWSNDGAYAYIDFDPHTDGYWEPYHQGIVLYRLNLETGQISEVLPLGKSDWIFYSFAFSPNDRRLAYIVTDKSPVILNVRDMQTGEEQSFEFDPKYNTGGGFLWSPDSQSVVFSITQYDTNIHEYIATSIVLCEPKRPACTTLLTDHKEVLVPVEWVNDSFILLQVLYQDEIKFELNQVTGELKQVSP